MSTYRPEVDGLRAIAIIPVVFYHAGFSHFEGGYVGVDVFFVISGYLITRILLRALSSDRFSYARFFESRIRRLLPALYAIILAFVPLAWFWMSPDELSAFFKSLISTFLMNANTYFWKDVGYFDGTAEFKPLLHIWSLSIEQQFYLVFPFAVVLIWRYHALHMSTAFLLVAVISLCLAQWASTNHPNANFFLLPTRGWEFMIGSLVAAAPADAAGLPSRHRTLPRIWRELAATAGLGAIIYAIATFNDETRHPSVTTLIPTVGTAAVLYFADKQTLIGRLLAQPAVVIIGLISYSAYLWHQPIFAFARFRLPTPPTTDQYLILILIAFVLAYATWRFIENPFRSRKTPTRTVLALAVIVPVIAIPAAAYVIATGGASLRTVQNGTTFAELKLDQRLRNNYGLSLGCEGTLPSATYCRTDDQPEVLVWGDSIAMHLTAGLVASHPSISIVQATKSTCGPLLDAAVTSRKYPVKWSAGCIEFNRRTLEWLGAAKSVRYVVLSSAFEQYLRPGAKIRVGDQSIAADPEVVYRHMMLTLNKIAALNIRPVIFAPPPTNEASMAHCVKNRMVFGGDPSKCTFDIAKPDPLRRTIVSLLRRIEKQYPVVWLENEICPANTCRGVINDRIIYRDRAHLSYEGSEMIGRKLNFYELVRSARPNP